MPAGFACTTAPANSAMPRTSPTVIVRNTGSDVTTGPRVYRAGRAVVAWCGMSSWMERASDAASRAVHDVAQAVASVFEAAGNRAQDALDQRAGVFGWLGGVASGVGDVLGALIIG